MPASAPQILLFDADDTLWENNIYFERVIGHFLDRLAHSSLSRTAIRGQLNAIERQQIARLGYGVRSFARALEEAYRQLAEKPPSAEDISIITALALQIEQEPVQLLPDVARTLAALSRRHRMILVTKGDYAEQTSKLERSGLREFFEQCHIVGEKNTGLYTQLRDHLHASAPGAACAPADDNIWMIGNSPRSDINPALAAGLRAVLIPHPHTWVLEHEDLSEPPADRFLRLEQFRDLCLYF